MVSGEVLTQSAVPEPGQVILVILATLAAMQAFGQLILQVRADEGGVRVLVLGLIPIDRIEASRIGRVEEISFLEAVSLPLSTIRHGLRPFSTWLAIYDLDEERPRFAVCPTNLRASAECLRKIAARNRELRAAL